MSASGEKGTSTTAAYCADTSNKTQVDEARIAYGCKKSRSSRIKASPVAIVSLLAVAVVETYLLSSNQQVTALIFG
jgi:hypothetical protein